MSFVQRKHKPSSIVGIVVNLVLGLTCLPFFYQLDDEISAGETALTVNPVQTTSIYRGRLSALG